MGTTVLKYAAVVGHHVKSIDQHEMVEDLTCTSGSLVLHVGEEAGVGVGLVPGDILVGSSAYGCHTDLPSGRDHGRHTEEGVGEGGGHGIIRRVQSVDFDQNGDVVVTTTPASHSDCFASSQIDFQWTPPHHGQDPLEAAQKRHEIWEDSMKDERDRELLNMDALMDACRRNSSISWLGDIDVNCNMDVLEFFDFYADMFSVNYDPIRKGAKEHTIMALGDTVRFDETYAALNLQINSRLYVDNYELDEFRLTIDGNAHAQSIVTINDPVQAAEAFLNRLFEELDVGGCMSTIEFYVSFIPVRIKPCWDLAVEFESSTDVKNFAVRSGFLMDASLSLGVEYDKANDDWKGVREWNWEMQYYRPLWHTTTMTTESMMRFYVIPEVTFVVYDVIPLTIYPKPFIGVGFKEKDAQGRLPSEGMGVWKVKLGEARGFSSNDITPNYYVKAEVLGCMDVLWSASESGTAKPDVEGMARNKLYADHKSWQGEAESEFFGLHQLNSGAAATSIGGSQYGNRTNTTIPIVKHPGCVLESSKQYQFSDFSFDEWLVFQNAPMFAFEASLNENILFEVWDDDGVNWFNEDDLLGSSTFNAVDAAKVSFGTVHTTTIQIAGGELDVEIKWERLTEEEYTTFLTDGGYAPEPYDGCWRPDGVAECKTFEDMEASARRRMTEVCEVESHATTCQCEGLNTHLNYGMDLGLGVGEILLNFDFNYENTQYTQQRYFSGQLVNFNLWPQTDLVCLDCEGCLATLEERTRSSGWTYSEVVDPETGVAAGWVQTEETGVSSKWVLVGVGIGMAALISIAGIVIFFQRRRAEGGGMEMDGLSIFRTLGFKAATGGQGQTVIGKDGRRSSVKSVAMVSAGGNMRKGSSNIVQSSRRSSAMLSKPAGGKGAAKKHGGPNKGAGTSHGGYV
ncbi:hypothetical protein TrRE_jg2512 [Triparma retinervis]|uniref:Uncharacterized protein n=1 Tax=Triparma retinervis TaxID=2557542 RepID=A0A9W7FVS1_9STRA|nr:hypothetical protein TrRE_jg2512 [Triparma retinervis]